MKRLDRVRCVCPPRVVRQHMGFTLVELLVVITIIALLAGLLLPVIIGVIKKAEISKANAEVNALAAAVEHYQVEYSRYPGQNSGNTDHQYSSSEYNKYLIPTLIGSNITWNGTPSNPKGITFLAVDSKSIVSNTLSGSNAQAGDLADPWANRYEVIADWNFDNTVSSPTADGDKVSRGVAVWSWGPNGCAPTSQRTPNAQDKTHIRSWK